MAGRKSEFSQDIADKICERIAAAESLRSICDSDEFPSAATVFKWLNDFPAFSEQYARAKEESADAIFDEMMEIADNARNDWMEQHGKDDVGYQLNGEHIQRSRLRVDTRKWILGKLKPKKYGDKISAELSGADGAPLALVIRDMSKGE